MVWCKESDVEHTQRTTRNTDLRQAARRVDPLIIALLIALGALVLIIGMQRPEVFFLPKNILNIGQAVTMIGLVALAQTVVIISGGMDLSVGSVVGLVSICIGLAMQPNDSLLVGILAGLAVGAVAGLVNGLMVTQWKFEPVIATLGTMAVFRGAAFIMTKGAPIGIMSSTFNKIGSGTWLGLPIPVVIFLAAAVLMHVFLTMTDVGRKIFVIGGNAVAARLGGIPINRYRLFIFTLSGVVAGIASIILTARSNAGQPNAGVGLEMDSITAAALGGTALSGGKGSMLGTILGVLILGVLQNGMILLNVSQFYQFIAKGALLILAVLLQRWLQKS
jgi:ribose transport system permease protein/L-arabinose transport system permease protein